MDGQTGSSLPPSPTHPDANGRQLGLSNALLPLSSSSSPLGIRAEHTRTCPTLMPRVGCDFGIHLTISYIRGKPSSGCEDVGQQGVPWDSGDSAVGGPGDVLKARREGREFGELGRAKHKSL